MPCGIFYFFIVNYVKHCDIIYVNSNNIKESFISLRECINPKRRIGGYRYYIEASNAYDWEEVINYENKNENTLSSSIADIFIISLCNNSSNLWKNYG